MLSGKSPLDGYWEEGYHYYLYIKGKSAELRDYAKRVIFKTSIKYDKKALEKGEKTELVLGDTVLSRAANGEPMTWIKKLYYEGGEIVMEYYYTIMGDTTYKLHKVDHGPFDNIVIRDGEILPKIQGEWIEWRKDGNYKDNYGIRIKNGTLRYGTDTYSMFKAEIHAISYKTSPNWILITPKDLTVTEFPGMSQINYEGNMLTSYMIICDVSTPMSVFMRRNDLGKIPVPPDALREARNTMLCVDEPMTSRPMTDEPMIYKPENEEE